MENRIKGKKAESTGRGPFGLLNRLLRLDGLLKEGDEGGNGLPARFMPYALFIMVVGVIYIGNRHLSDRMIRSIDRMEAEVEDLRADFTTLKADYMFASKQSEVARKVKNFGLQETRIPPYKIVVDPDEYRK